MYIVGAEVLPLLPVKPTAVMEGETVVSARLKDAVRRGELESVTVMTRVVLPSVVGVPLKTPVSGSRNKPGGTAPNVDQ
jgi:hypothetical protein